MAKLFGFARLGKSETRQRRAQRGYTKRAGVLTRLGIDDRPPRDPYPQDSARSMKSGGGEHPIPQSKARTFLRFPRSPNALRKAAEQPGGGNTAARG